MLPRDYQSNPDMGNRRVDVVGSDYSVDEYDYEHLVNTSAVCNTSASHTYGNVLGLVEKYLLDLFPDDTFKTVTCSTSLAHRQLKHLPSKLNKQEPPIMVLSPRIVFGQDENRFLGHTIFNDRVGDWHAVWGNGSLMLLAKDNKRQIYVHGHYNRAVMYVDVVTYFETYNEQLNWTSYLYNAGCIGHNQFVRAPLELYIPGRFCSLISNVSGVSGPDFLTYMNSIFSFPITYKLKGGSGTDEYFMYYVTDVDTLIQDVNMGQGMKDGQIRRGFDVTFTVRVEFNTVGYFTLSAPRLRHPVEVSEPEGDAIVPLMSDVINLDDFVLPLGWDVLCWPIFKLAYGESSVSLSSILNDSLTTVIDYHLQMGMPMDSFINIEFRENGAVVDEPSYIDWEKRELHILNPNYRRTYRLIVTVCGAYINELVKSIYHLE